MKEIDQVFESLGPVKSFLVTCLMGLLAHLDIVASVLAIVVLLFQFKVVFLNGKVKAIELKLKKREYKKSTEGKRNGSITA